MGITSAKPKCFRRKHERKNDKINRSWLPVFITAVQEHEIFVREDWINGNIITWVKKAK